MYKFLFLISVLSLASTQALAHPCPEDLVGKYQNESSLIEFEQLGDINNPVYRVTFKSGNHIAQKILQIGNGADCSEVTTGSTFFKTLNYTDLEGNHSFWVGYLNGAKFLRQELHIENHFVSRNFPQEGVSYPFNGAIPHHPIFEYTTVVEGAPDLFASVEDCPDLSGNFQMNAEEVTIEQIGPIFRITRQVNNLRISRIVELGKGSATCYRVPLNGFSFKVFYFENSPFESHSYSVYYTNGQKYLLQQISFGKYLRGIEEVAVPQVVSQPVNNSDSQDSLGTSNPKKLPKKKRSDKSKDILVKNVSKESIEKDQLREQFHIRFKQLLQKVKEEFGIGPKKIIQECGFNKSDISNLKLENRSPTIRQLEGLKKFFTAEEVEMLWPKDKLYLLQSGEATGLSGKRQRKNLTEDVTELNRF